MAVLKYRSNDGTIKTLGLISTSGGSVTSVNGKTGAVTGLYDSKNPPPYPVRSVNGKTGAVTIETSIIKTATLTFSFSVEDIAHICKSNIVSNSNKIISIKPVLGGIFAGGIEYSNGYIITNFINRDAELVTETVTCNVVYYE